MNNHSVLSRMGWGQGLLSSTSHLQDMKPKRRMIQCCCKSSRMPCSSTLPGGWGHSSAGLPDYSKNVKTEEPVTLSVEECVY